MTEYREKIIELGKEYYDELEDDFSHNFDHHLRVERLAKEIAKEENADIEIVEAASLLIDIARGLEDRGETKDHAEEGNKIAKEILEKVAFPDEKINSVCHAILVHRKSKERSQETIEAKIIQDADYLDALGAVDIARVMGSSFQSKKYKRPIYIDKPINNINEEKNDSAIRYIIYELNNPKLQPDNFNTKLAKELAKGRIDFLKDFKDRFIEEWNGKK